MKTKYRFIEFKELAPKPKTRVWSMVNLRSQDEIGRVEWYPQWRRYCYSPTCPAWMSEECLFDIIDFLKQADKDQERRRAVSRKERDG